jgi:hypothetical protein
MLVLLVMRVLHACTACLQYDLDDNGRLDSTEFVKMLQSLGTDVSKDEADAAMEVREGGSWGGLDVGCTSDCHYCCAT